MTAQTKLGVQTPEVDPIYLLTKLVELETKMIPLADAIMALKETNEGTLRTQGMKAKMVLAEENIKANKEAFLSLEKKIDDGFASLARKEDENKTAIQKIQPYINFFAWLVAVAGPIIISLIINGKWFVGPTP